MEFNTSEDYVLYARSIAYFYLHRFEESLSDFLEGVEIKKKWSKFSIPEERFLILSLIYHKLGKETEALVAFKKSNYNTDLISSRIYLLKTNHLIKDEYIEVLLDYAEKLENHKTTLEKGDE